MKCELPLTPLLDTRKKFSPGVRLVAWLGAFPAQQSNGRHPFLHHSMIIFRSYESSLIAAVENLRIPEASCARDQCLEYLWLCPICLIMHLMPHGSSHVICSQNSRARLLKFMPSCGVYCTEPVLCDPCTFHARSLREIESIGTIEINSDLLPAQLACVGW